MSDIEETKCNGYHSLSEADGTSPCTTCGNVDVATQDRVGAPHGNCTAACIATLIGVPLGAIPNFNLWPDVFGDWYNAARAWLSNQGYELSDGWGYEFSCAQGIGLGLIKKDEPLLAGGINPDGVGHMVVWRLDKGLIHDPNPTRRGLDGNPEFVCTLRPKVEPAHKALYAVGL